MIQIEEARALVVAAERSPDVAARFQIVETLVRLELASDVWQELGDRVLSLLELQPGVRGRSHGVELMGALPIPSARERLRRMAADEADPDRELAARRLAEEEETEAEHIARLVEQLRAGETGALLPLAASPIESYAVHPEPFTTAYESEDITEVFWAAIALGRLGRLEPVDRLLARLEGGDPPPFMWGDPWTAYDQIAPIRPVPPALRDHLLAREEDVSNRDAKLLIWAATGTRDAEGIPIDEDAGTTRDRPADPADRLREAAREVADRVRGERDAVLATSTLGSGDLQLLAALPAEDAGELMATVAERVATLTRDWEPVVGGNFLLDLSGVLDLSRLSVDRILNAHARTDVVRQAFAFVLSRAPRERVMPAILQRLGTADPAEISNATTLIQLVEHYAAGGRAPYAGAGPAPAVSPASVDWGEAATAEPVVGEQPPPAGAAPTEAEAAGEDVPTIVSAEAPSQLVVGDSDELRIRIERAGSAAAPLAVSETVTASDRVDFSVLVHVEGSAIELVDPWLKTLPPPTPERASTEAFEIRAVGPGRASIAVKFLQGSQPIAALTIELEAVRERSAEGVMSARGEGRRSDPETFGRTAFLHIEERRGGDGATYSYLLTAPFIGLANARWEQQLDGTTEQYLLRLHRELVEQIRAQSETDVEQFAREIATKGLDMSRRLLPPDLVRDLWDRREEVDQVLLNTEERRPLPWELLRLAHPDMPGRSSWDTRHLAEYGVTRQLTRYVGKLELGGSRWGYMLADYPYQSYPPTDFGRDYFETELKTDPAVAVEPLPSDPVQLVDSITAGGYDVIHLGCHGESELDGEDSTWLIVSDRRTRRDTPEGPVIAVEPVRLTPEFVRNQIDLREHAPIVFLNACESGRRPPGIHGLDGWPDVFLGAGAGAVVGTSWSVKGEAAEAFAVEFYRALRRSETLAAATRAGRSAAHDVKQDASWLAYSVYGYPAARIQKGE